MRITWQGDVGLGRYSEHGRESARLGERSAGDQAGKPDAEYAIELSGPVRRDAAVLQLCGRGGLGVERQPATRKNRQEGESMDNSSTQLRFFPHTATRCLSGNRAGTQFSVAE
jgi:hypothetical protein